MRMELVFLETNAITVYPTELEERVLSREESRVPSSLISAEWEMHQTAIQLPVNW